jgi:hypothetical protein
VPTFALYKQRSPIHQSRYGQFALKKRVIAELYYGLVGCYANVRGLVLPDVSKDRNAFIFKDQRVKDNVLHSGPLKMWMEAKGTRVLRIVGKH